MTRNKASGVAVYFKNDVCKCEIYKYYSHSISVTNVVPGVVEFIF